MKKTLTAVLSFTILVTTAQAIAIPQRPMQYNFSAATDPLIKANLYKPKTAADLVRASAVKFRVPVDFALQVAKQETGIRCGLIGAAGERGPLQILPSSARGLGYKNIRSASCARQTEAGMAHLAMCWQEAEGNRRAAARCHNGGIGRTWSKNRAVNRYADAVLSASVIWQGKPITKKD
jgi:soluble lytic murein transglycosylase-like protein